MRLRFKPLLIPTLVVVLALSARLIPGPRAIDDAFITYRYARNLVSGEGFVYNPGEKVLGTTTPLYTLLMATLALPTGGAEAPFPALALGVNALADALTCLVLLAIGRRLGAPLAGLSASMVWAIAPFSVTFAIGGLETSLYVLLLAGTMAAYLEAKYTLAALTASLALLTRPDALLFLAPLALDRLRLTREPSPARLRASEMLAFATPTLLWVGFASAYFGSTISHSVTAKSMAYRLPPSAAFVRLLQHYATPFLGHLTFGVTWIGVGLILYPALFLIGARKALQQDRRTWPFLLYPWVYFAAFAAFNPLIFRWYLTPPLPFYILPILMGAERLLDDLTRRREAEPWPDSRPSTRLIQVGLPLLLIVLTPLAFSLKDWTLHPDHGADRPAPRMAWYLLELTYRQAAEFLAPALDATTTLAASDVGVLGYYTPARILDTVGLNSPQALRYYPLNPDYYVINLATSPDLIIETQPDYIVLLEVYGREGVFKDPRFQQQYRLLRKIPTDIYGSDGMLIFRREAGG